CYANHLFVKNEENRTNIKRTNLIQAKHSELLADKVRAYRSLLIHHFNKLNAGPFMNHITNKTYQKVGKNTDFPLQINDIILRKKDENLNTIHHLTIDSLVHQQVMNNAREQVWKWALVSFEKKLKTKEKIHLP